MSVRSRGSLYCCILLSFIIMIVAGCGGSDSSTPDRIAPTLVTTLPENNSTKVFMNTPISAVFSENVNIDAFVLTSKQGTNIPGTVSGSGTNTISFTPSVRLNYGTPYTARITNVRDGEGNKLGLVTWSFTMAGEVLNYHTTPDSHYYDAGEFNSIALSPVDGKSYITYYNATTRSLYIIATLDGTTFDGPYRIDAPTSLEKVGEYSSLAIDASGTLHVSYYHEMQGLKYATAPSAAAPWTTAVVDGGSLVGTHTSLALDKNSRVHISYYDMGNTALKYATNATGEWKKELVYSGLPQDNPGQYTSIKVGSDDMVHISFYDYHAGAATNSEGNLMYAFGSFGTWSLRTLDSTGNVGEFSSLFLYNGKVYITYNHVFPAGNRTVRIITNASGDWRHFDIVTVSRSVNDPLALTANPLFIDSTGMMHVSYYTPGTNGFGILNYATGILYEAVGNTWEWSFFVVDTSEVGPGVYTSIVVDLNGKANIAYYDATDGDLKFAE